MKKWLLFCVIFIGLNASFAMNSLNLSQKYKINYLWKRFMEKMMKQ